MAAVDDRPVDYLSPDTMRILVASDNHLGYLETDAVRGQDSLVTFEEILQLAQQHDVDFILLAGDLFHYNKPSRNVLHEAMSLLRKYCMGRKPVQFEYLGDQAVDFGHTAFPKVNYRDDNLNVSIPVFSIYGKHDDPAGRGNLCALDVLSTAGLVNYFGKYDNTDTVTISPLLLQKGDTKLALYGLGATPDEELLKKFRGGDVKCLKHNESKDEWFNILTVHQNRQSARNSSRSCIPDIAFPPFLDLVVWGSEHECRLIPEIVGSEGASIGIIQPGSSVATSLKDGEAAPKHVGLLSVQNGKHFIEQIRLQTVRQFYIEDIVLADSTINAKDPHSTRDCEEYCAQKVRELLEKAREERSGHPKQPEHPLIRLRVDYSGNFETFNKQMFGQKFVGQVANPQNLVLFHRSREHSLKGDRQDWCEFDIDLRTPNNAHGVTLRDVIQDTFRRQKVQMSLFSDDELTDAVGKFVDKGDTNAFSALVNTNLQNQQAILKAKNLDVDDIEREIKCIVVESPPGRSQQQDEDKTGVDPETSRFHQKEEFDKMDIETVP